MLTIAVIIALAAAGGLLTFLGSFIGSLAAHLTKNEKVKVQCRKNRKSSIIFFGITLIGFIAFVHFNGDKIANESAKGAGKLVGRFFGAGAATAGQSFEQSWDGGRVEQMRNLSVALGGITTEPDGDNIIYQIEVILNNQSPADTKLYWADLIGNGQLAVCDSDGFVYDLSYTVSSTESWERIKEGNKTTDIDSYNIDSNTKISFGKSRMYFMVTRPKDALPIDHLQYLGEQIY